jgi:DNA-binding transcriptional ArsR family regulator
MSSLKSEKSTGKGAVMSHHLIGPETLILERLSRADVVTMEELTTQLPELSWSTLFQTIDVLSRSGMVELRRKGFQYELRIRTSAMVETA